MLENECETSVNDEGDANITGCIVL